MPPSAAQRERKTKLLPFAYTLLGLGQQGALFPQGSPFPEIRASSGMGPQLAACRFSLTDKAPVLPFFGGHPLC